MQSHTLNLQVIVNEWVIWWKVYILSKNKMMKLKPGKNRLELWTTTSLSSHLVSARTHLFLWHTNCWHPTHYTEEYCAKYWNTRKIVYHKWSVSCAKPQQSNKTAKIKTDKQCKGYLDLHSVYTFSPGNCLWMYQCLWSRAPTHLA